MINRQAVVYGLVKLITLSFWTKWKWFDICLNVLADNFKASYEKLMLSQEVLTQLNNPLYFSGVIIRIWEASCLYSVFLWHFLESFRGFRRPQKAACMTQKVLTVSTVSCSQCVLCRCEKALPALSFWAVLSMSSRRSNSFSVWEITEGDAFGSWWGFYCWFVFLLICWVFLHLVNSKMFTNNLPNN